MSFTIIVGTIIQLVYDNNSTMSEQRPRHLGRRHTPSGGRELSHHAALMLPRRHQHQSSAERLQSSAHLPASKVSAFSPIKH